ncbi:hypothetical protein HDE_13765 [Halotydeus destructor]|nr:hypothetical protein HDE_13765 [Halotydeus destructor]
MATLAETIAIILIVTCVKVNGVTFKDILPEVYHPCCTDKITSCGPIEAAVRGNKQFYVFYRNYYTTFSTVRQDGDPVLVTFAADVTKDWPNQSGKEILLTGTRRHGKIELIDQYAQNVYNSKRQLEVERLIICSDTVSTDKLLCDPEQHGTVDSIMVISRGKGNKPLIYAWYRDQDAKKHTLYIYDGEGGHLVNHTVESGPFQTRETVVYFDNGVTAKGYDFVDDNRAFLFTIMGDHDSKVMEKVNRHPGFASQVFLGCPRAFCYNANADAFNYETDTKSLTIYARQYYYRQKYASLPLDLPLAAEARLIGDDLLQDHPKHVDALVAFDGNLFLVKDDTYVWYIRGKKAASGQLSYMFKGVHDISYVDALWLNTADKRIYAFYRNHYHRFKYDKESDRFVAEVHGKKISDFAGFPVEGIDAVVSFQDGVSYFLKRNWYYKVNDRTALTESHEPRFVLGSNVQDEPFFSSAKCAFGPTELDAMKVSFNKDYYLTPMDPNGVDDDDDHHDPQGVGQDGDRPSFMLVFIAAGVIGLLLIGIIIALLVTSTKKTTFQGMLLDSTDSTTNSTKKTVKKMSDTSIVTVNSTF